MEQNYNNNNISECHENLPTIAGIMQHHRTHVYKTSQYIQRQHNTVCVTQCLSCKQITFGQQHFINIKIVWPDWATRILVWLIIYRIICFLCVTDWTQNRQPPPTSCVHTEVGGCIYGKRLPCRARHWQSPKHFSLLHLLCNTLFKIVVDTWIAKVYS